MLATNNLSKYQTIFIALGFCGAIATIISSWYIFSLPVIRHKDGAFALYIFNTVLCIVLVICLFFLWHIITNSATGQSHNVPSQFPDLEKTAKEKDAWYHENGPEYYLTIARASDVACVADRQGNFIYVSMAMCTMLGYSREELLQMNVKDIIDPDDLRATPIVSAELEPPHCVIRDRRFIRKNGNGFNVRITINIFEADRVMVIVQDVSHEKEVETQLKNAELKFRMIAEKSLVGIYIIQNEKFTYVNPRFAELFGYKPDELINSIPITNVINEVYRKITDDYIRSKLDNEVDSVYYETMGRKKDGSENWLELYGSCVDLDNIPTIIGSVIDITKRKKAEELIIKEKKLSETIIKSLPGVFYLQNNQGQFLRWNSNLETITGYTSEEIAAMGRGEMIAPEDLQKVRKAVQTVFSEGYASVEANCISKTGAHLPFLLTGIPIIYNNQSCLLGVGIDISLRKKAEKDLKISEQKYKFLFENNPLPMLVWDFETLKIIDCNEEAVSKYGYTCEEFFDLTIKDLSPVEDIPIIEETVGNNEGYNRIHKKTWKHRKKNGELIFMEVNAHLVKYNGRLVSISQNIDVTEKLKAEQELQASEERYKLLFYYNPIPMFLYDFNTHTVLDANNIAVKNYGYSKSELLNMTLYDIRPPQEIPMAEKILKNLQRDHKSHHLGIFNHQKKDKTIIKVDVWAYSFNYLGRDCILSVYNDITDLENALEQVKRNERMLLSAQKIAKIGSWSFDFAKQNALWSNEVYRIWGVSEQSFIPSYESFFNSVHPDEKHTFMELWNSAIRGECEFDFEHRIILPDGSVKWVHELGQIIKDNKDKLIAFEGSVQDITSQKTLSLSLEESEKRIRKFAKRLNNMLEDDRARIAREVHDEFGQQLSGLKMSLASFKKTNGITNEIAKAIDTLISDVNHSIQCLRKIATELRPVIIDKLGLFEAIKWMLREYERKQGIIGHIYLETNHVINNKVLSINIFRIVQEALTNIAKHANATTVHIRIEHLGDDLIIKIIDNGKGICLDNVHNPLSMGLLNMQERAMLIGARINIIGVPNSGTTIELVIKTNE